MLIVIIDQDSDRIKSLHERVAALAPTCAVRALAKSQALAVITGPSLVLCHIGDRQHDYEQGRLGKFLQEILKDPACTVAGYSGGAIAASHLKRMPPCSDRFVHNIQRVGVGAGGLNKTFMADVQRLTNAWLAGGGKLTPGALEKAWLDLDPALEAKLRLLSSLLKGDADPNMSDEALLEQLRSFNVILSIEEIRPIREEHALLRRIEPLIQLRNRWFGFPGGIRQ
jgi:hypothetical protein